MEDKIKVGFLISYDYEMLKESLPLVYQDADTITLAIDVNNQTWAGTELFIPPDFFAWLQQFDRDKKVVIYRDVFYLPELSVMENDTRERKMLAKFMGPGGWHIQIDTDEYFIDFKQFVHFLRHDIKQQVRELNAPVSVYVNWISLYKKVESGYLTVTSLESASVATRYPEYVHARNTGHDRLFTNFLMVHQSWARSEEEISLKLKNWSHKDDFNTSSYFNFWKVCDQYNYKFYNDFHPLNPPTWKALSFTECKTITGFIDHYKAQNPNLFGKGAYGKTKLVVQKKAKRSVFKRLKQLISK